MCSLAWDALSNDALLRIPEDVVRLAVAEGLVRLACVRRFGSLSPVRRDGAINGAREEADLEHVPILIRVLLGKAETVAGGGGSPLEKGEGEKAWAGTLLLCLIRRVWGQPRLLNESQFLDGYELPALPPGLLLRFARLFLMLLRNAPPFLQDVCRTGLCWCYDVSTRLLDHGQITEVLVSEVVSTITRDKRPIGRHAGRQLLNSYRVQYVPGAHSQSYRTGVRICRN